MTRIDLQMEIEADKKICFDLSRSIDLHQFTTKETKEKAIGGRIEGLINEGEWVKWQAVHFGIPQTMTVEIKKMKPYDFFIDEMIEGPFRSMKHLHTFETQNGRTILSDVFEYEVPYGLAGKLFDHLILKRYMTRFLEQRNRIIKEIAESHQWKTFLTSHV
jgi:ligand-binding SRPBCC domain-containing protein